VWGALHVPLIMVGPGTGLAPLRAFAQERAVARRRLAALGVPPPRSSDLLFFGCRRESEDFLYRFCAPPLPAAARRLSFYKTC